MTAERDCSHLRRLDDGLAYVDSQLTEWAKWAKQSMNLGWPPQSVYTKDRIGGAGPPPAEMPEHVWIVEKALLQIKDIERQVVVTYYTEWTSKAVMARWRNMSVSRFDKLLKAGRWHIKAIID